MLLEIARLLLGLGIALFHKQLADFIFEQDRSLTALFRQRGVTLPLGPSREAAHTLYFARGITVAVISMGRIWLLMS